MYASRYRSGYHRYTRRKRFLRIGIALLVIGIFAVTGVFFAGKLWDETKSGQNELLQLWEAQEYKEVYNQSKLILASRPLDCFFLTMFGFSAYQLAVSQISSQEASGYFDDCIKALRKALLLEDAENDGRLYYVLGKAYSYKGDSYTDLTIKYLEKAREISYNAADIPEYLGLAYASIGDYRSSVAVFSEALEPLSGTDGISDGNAEVKAAPSGILLFSIAKSYFALGDSAMARLYLQHCISSSRDSRIVFLARLLLAEDLINSGDYDSAEKHIRDILSETGENAEALFLLGEVYASQGNNTRARSQWRRVLEIDPVHANARARLAR